jgi:4-amino-4-deoxy-L-arabinose transferase-like glycosyltransferase
MANAATHRQQTFASRGLLYILDVAAASHRNAALFLLLVSLLAFLPGIGRMPPVDREEPRFAQSTRQMIESGDYVDIRFQDGFRYSKPIGVYWLQALVVKPVSMVVGPQALSKIGYYRVPSLIGAIGAVLATYWAALVFVSRRGAVLAGLMLASSILLGLFARLATTDSLLLMTVTFAIGALARAYKLDARTDAEPPGLALPAIFWTALAAGFLLKGPVILVFVGLTGATLAFIDRRAGWLKLLRPGLGIIWFLVLVVPWFALILMRSGRYFLSDSLVRDFLGRIANIREYRFLPPGFYLVTFFVTFWPASLLAGLAAPAIWHSRHSAPTRFLLAWLVPAWLLLELILAKLPHFSLPLYPAIAILIAGCIETHQLSNKRWMVAGTFWWFFVPVFVSVAGVLALITLEGRLGFSAWPFAALAVVCAFRAWWLYDSDGPERSLLRAVTASLFLSAALYAVILPSLSTMFPTMKLQRAIRGAGCAEPRIASAGLHEPSMVFLGGTNTQLTDGAGAAEFLRGGDCRFAIVESRYERNFIQRADALGLRYTRELRIEGFNPARGRRMMFSIYRSRGDNNW